MALLKWPHASRIRFSLPEPNSRFAMDSAGRQERASDQLYQLRSSATQLGLKP
jgi:hypothetical protein